MIEDVLSSLRLSDKEVGVYKALLETGKATAVRISTETGINRTTVYAVCKELVGKGYVQEDNTKKIIYYLPTPPKELLKITKRERQALIDKELAIGELAKTITDLPQSKSYVVPKIRFVEHEDKVLEYLYDNTDKWYGALPPQGREWYGFQDHTFVEYEPYLKWIDWHWKSSPDSNLYLLTNNSDAEKKLVDAPYPNRNIKFWNKGFDFTESQWIVGDFSILLMTRQKPHYLVELHDAVYADNMRKLFKELWDKS